MGQSSIIAATLELGRANDRVWDVVVIGAGPGGALAARQVALKGARVLLVDRKQFPRPKVCGACLNGKALAVLESVGLGDRVRGLGGLDLTRFHVRLGGRESRLQLPAGRAVSRDRLDSAMVEEAIDAGSAFLPATTATLEPGNEDERGLRLIAEGRETSIRARVVVVASGLGGLDLESEPALRSRVSGRTRIGAGCVVEVFPDSYEPGTIHMAVGRSGYVGLVRVESGLLNVASAFDRPFVRSLGGPGVATDEVLREAGFPKVPALSGARWRGTVGLSRRTRPVGGHRLFLIGDAAGYVEPFTGEGMGAALTSAKTVTPLVLRGVDRWDPWLAREWSRRYHRHVGRGQWVCRGLTLVSRHPWATRSAFRFSAGFPGFSRILIGLMNKPPVSYEAI